MLDWEGETTLLVSQWLPLAAILPPRTHKPDGRGRKLSSSPSCPLYTSRYKQTPMDPTAANLESPLPGTLSLETPPEGDTGSNSDQVPARIGYQDQVLGVEKKGILEGPLPPITISHYQVP